MTTATATDPFAHLEPGDDGLVEGLVIYRRLARELHPDKGGDDDAMVALNAAWEVAQRRLRGEAASVIITSKRHAYAVERPLVAGDAANLYVATCDKDEVVLKVVRDPRNADLLAAEVETLKLIHAAHHDGRNGWFPWVHESFAFSAPGKPRLRTTVLDPLYGFYDLTEVTRAGVLHPRDVAWIARRLLHVLAQAHAVGRVHGAVIPEHVMVHPKAHRVVMVGWGASMVTGQPIKAMSRNHPAWYPPEVAAKEPAGPETDLFMFGRVLYYMASWPRSSGAADRLRTFASGCTIANRRWRPKEAHVVLSEFDDLLERMWGPRTYHEFEMPGPPRL